MRIASLIALTSSLAACAVDGDDTTQGGNGKADGNGSCTAPEYWDGVCQIDIACDVPDIDCYTLFESDDAAAAWLDTQMPYTRVPATDPRAVKAQKLVDRAFKLFKSRVQLGALADKRLSVVVLEGGANAFIAGDPMTNKGGWSVQVQTGLLDGQLTDDQVVGVMVHELTHLAKLHFIPEVTDRVRKFYIAPAGKEPIGEQVAEEPTAKQHGAAWRKAAALAGPFTNPELGAFPLLGTLDDIFYAYVTGRLAASCPSQASTYSEVHGTLTARISTLDFNLTIDAGMASAVKNATDALLACGAANPMTLRAYLDSEWPEWIPYLQPLLSPEEVPLLDKPIVQAITTLITTHRAQMIAAQEKYAKETARPWSSLRFYSFEEAADDSWVRIYQTSDLDGAGSFKGAFLSFLGAQAPACEQALTTGTAPYGSNYLDEHHGECWRIAHAAQIAAKAQTTARTTELAETRVPHEPYHRPQRPGANPIY